MARPRGNATSTTTAHVIAQAVAIHHTVRYGDG